MMKVWCSWHRRAEPVTNFAKRANGKYRPVCKAGSVEYNRTHRATWPGKLMTLRQNLLRYGITPAEARAIVATLSKPEKCFICKAPMTWQEGALDHIFPVSRGGKTFAGNLAFSHKNCNQIKGDMTMQELREFCQLLASLEEKHA